MTNEKMNEYALMRYGIIAPVICRTLPPETSVKEFLLEASNQTYTDPSGKRRRFSFSTLERWLYSYRKSGFAGLMPNSRSDCGKFRKIDDEIQEIVRNYKKEHPRAAATDIYAKLVNDGVIINGSISLSTLTRCLNKIKEESNIQDTNEMRRYERPHINEVWCGDSCVGPKIISNGGKKRVYIIALIDDASRFIPGALATYEDNFVSLMKLIRTSTAKYGVPKRFNFDNGKSYRNNQMDLLAARMGCMIHYCHPYTPTQKAKIERWFRTLRDKWFALIDLNGFSSLEQIQKCLDEFVLKYNQTVHSSLNGLTPEERFFMESDRIHRLPPESLDGIFLLEIERKVSVDCVISINNVEYEVDCKYAGRKIILRYSPDMKEIYVVDSSGELSPVRLLNKEENSEIRRKKIYLSGGED